MSKAVIVYRDERTIEKARQDFDKSKELIENVVQAFNSMGLGTIENADELSQAIRKPGQFIQDKFNGSLEEKPRWGKVKISSEKLLHLADIDRQPFEKAAHDAMPVVGHFELLGTYNAKSGISISKKKLDDFIKRMTIQATTEREKAVAQALQGVAYYANELVKLGADPRGFMTKPAKDFLLGAGMNWQPSVSVFAFRYLTEKIKHNPTI